MLVLAIDPGPEHCGVAAYCTERRCVTFASKDETVESVLEMLAPPWKPVDLVAIERVQSYGISGGSLLRTAEVCGRLWQRAADNAQQVRLIYRREVLRALDVTGKGNRDSLVRHRLIEMHGGTRQAACGTKNAPGPLYGVSGHAWQALAVAVAAVETEPRHLPAARAAGPAG